MPDDIEVEDPQAIIATQSKMLGSKPAKMYVTEDDIILGKNEIKKSSIKDIQMIEDDRTDYKSVSIVLLNALIGVFLGISMSTFIPFTLLIIGLSAMAGYAVVRVTRDKPYGYVSLDTEHAEYRFGVADPISAAELFGLVYKELDKELTPDSFIVGDSNIQPPDGLQEYDDLVEE